MRILHTRAQHLSSLPRLSRITEVATTLSQTEAILHTEILMHTETTNIWSDPLRIWAFETQIITEITVEDLQFPEIFLASLGYQT